MVDLDHGLEKIKASRERWHRRLNRAVAAIKRLDAKEKRIRRKRLAPPANLDLPGPDLDLRDSFLDRTKNPADVAAAAEIRKAQADRKAVKAAASKARSKARARGELRRMPLQGKAALAAIRGEA